MARCVSGEEGALRGLSPAAGAIEALFARFDAELKRQGYLALGGAGGEGAAEGHRPAPPLTADTDTPRQAAHDKPPPLHQPMTSQTRFFEVFRRITPRKRLVKAPISVHVLS